MQEINCCVLDTVSRVPTFSCEICCREKFGDQTYAQNFLQLLLRFRLRGENFFLWVSIIYLPIALRLIGMWDVEIGFIGTTAWWRWSLRRWALPTLAQRLLKKIAEKVRPGSHRGLFGVKFFEPSHCFKVWGRVGECHSCRSFRLVRSCGD